jgi:hypothetical protein
MNLSIRSCISCLIAKEDGLAGAAAGGPAADRNRASRQMNGLSDKRQMNEGLTSGSIRRAPSGAIRAIINPWGTQMRNLLGLLSVAVLAVALTAGGASAARSLVAGPPPSNGGTPSGPPGTPGSGGNPGSSCTVLCFIPVFPHKVSLHYYQTCSDKLTQLGRVTVSQIQRVEDSAKVHVVPICDTTNNHSLTQPEQAFLSRGNVQGLLPAIAANQVLASKLNQSGYETNDVLGVQYASNATLLYVTHR